MEYSQKKIYVIINPVSGTKSKKDVPEKITQRFDQHEYDIHIFVTGYVGHATEIAQKAVLKKVDYVIAVGGDGTVNEVAKVLVDTDVIFGIIPSGSGNGLARELHIPLNISKAIEILKENNVKRIDYGVANGQIFFCTCGVGFDALISEKALEKPSRGKLMYAQSIISSLLNFKPQKYKITTSQGVYEDKAFLVTCANASQYGNDAFIAPHADIQDGKMNLAIVKPLSAVEVTQAAIQIFTKNIGNNAKLVEFITSDAVIERESDGYMHLDGNAAYTDKRVEVKIVPKGLSVLVPATTPKKKIDPQAFLNSITRWI